jgi:hypothetical protein
MKHLRLRFETYFYEYIAAGGIAEDKGGHDCARARDEGIEMRIGNYSLRATGITDYLKSEGTPEHAQNMAGPPPRGPRSCMIGATTRRHSMNMRK